MSVCDANRLGKEYTHWYRSTTTTDLRTRTHRALAHPKEHQREERGRGRLALLMHSVQNASRENRENVALGSSLEGKSTRPAGGSSFLFQVLRWMLKSLCVKWSGISWCSFSARRSLRVVEEGEVGVSQQKIDITSMYGKMGVQQVKVSFGSCCRTGSKGAGLRRAPHWQRRTRWLGR